MCIFFLQCASRAHRKSKSESPASTQGSSPALLREGSSSPLGSVCSLLVTTTLYTLEFIFRPFHSWPAEIHMQQLWHISPNCIYPKVRDSALMSLAWFIQFKVYGWVKPIYLQKALRGLCLYQSLSTRREGVITKTKPTCVRQQSGKAEAVVRDKK